MLFSKSSSTQIGESGPVTKSFSFHIQDGGQKRFFFSTKTAGIEKILYCKVFEEESKMAEILQFCVFEK
jgi:hypothetical protein